MRFERKVTKARARCLDVTVDIHQRATSPLRRLRPDRNKVCSLLKAHARPFLSVDARLLSDRNV
jgi:hypothetical protein